MTGILYLCATPIGNLEDITLRCVRVLREADIIAAEDTRQAIKLLNHFQIRKPLISYHEHNKHEKGKEIVELLRSGKNIALVSDAGMPAISDPGEELVRLCIDSGIEIIPLPGPSASLTALIVSGLSTRRFCFEGFLPSNKKERKERLKKLSAETRTIIVYEAPHRLLDTLGEIMEYLGDRRISVSREITKKFEETVRGEISSVIGIFKERAVKGEFVLIIEGISEKELVDIELKKWDNVSVEEHIAMYLQQGADKKEAIKMVAEDRKLPKKEVYKIGCNLERRTKNAIHKGYDSSSDIKSKS
ncbi:MAG TPA: 16S rRNA (cytidine(1402)-2'-O)-methyltransferase [Bacillota bacterium]|nr:16S rRNA (cytidine(1402)-2'-O)-methyltransferase [Bacillota bacterium]HNT02849.1 16S rRNA (cytidine(1402)-2'-O)-methyltransferase [Bacillota bacterium]HPA54772.1 16S rRNA (cytidine(1402)-2'-O)-methyltransferase [Bacillota bacterium]HPX69808.1 16S rRNA (cytidine(1402)-2'-O)-methyltransferase [Bacillota bacterium]HQA65180.1 16S rRNA (cytidine(1402)-2'-O)-methyltransferase [Bacillota bacterium]